MKRKLLSSLLALCLVFALTAELAPAWAVEENADLVFAAEGETIPAQDLREAGPEAEAEKEEISAEEVSAADLSAENPGAETEKAAEPAEAVPVSLSGEMRAAAAPGAEPNATTMTWIDLQTALNAGGAVSLRNNVTATSGSVCLTVPESVTVTLDLNGYTIDRALTEAVENGCVLQISGDLTLTDSSVGQTGTITGGKNTGNGGGVYVDGTFTMEGGEISGNTARYTGGGVCVSGGGTFTMEGGEISGNTANDGGGVCVYGTFTMEGGEISGNTAEQGGGAYVEFGSFTMGGGTISGNTAKNSGGGVYVFDESFFTMIGGGITGNTASNIGGGVCGPFMMTGGEISGNTADYSGGGVDVNSGPFTMEGGEISGNAAGYGGGVCVCGPFTMTGGKISGNTADYSGGGVRVGGGSTSTFRISGTPVITGNVQGGTITDGVLTGGMAQNVYLPNGKTITLSDVLMSDASVGVTTESLPTANSPVLLTNGLTSQGSIGSFFSDRDNYSIYWNNAGTEAVLYLNGSLFITAQPEDVTGIDGGTVQFHVGVSGSSVSYQWQYKKPNGSWTNLSSITGYNTDTLTVPVTAARNGYKFRCVVSSGTQSVTSNAATLTVFAITAQPENATGVAGKTVEYHVTATGDGLSYQWQYKKPSGNWTNLTSFTGHNTDTLTVPVTEVRNGYQYRCRVTCQGTVITSNAATLTVFALIAQPVDVTAASGTNADFYVTARGSGLTYQWQYKKPEGVWKDLGSMAGWNTNTLTVPAAAARNGYQYRCKVSCQGETIITDPATLTVFSITVQPKDATGIAGGTVDFHVEASIGGVSYRWQYKKPGGSWTNCGSFTGYNTATMTVPVTAARDGYQFRCKVTGGGTTITSSAATLTVASAPSITTQPAGRTGVVGKSVEFKVVASGTDLTYQWQYLKPNGSWTNCGSFTGYNTAAVTVPVTAARNGYQFRCKVTGGGTTVTSSAATLTVFALISQSGNVTAAAGTEAVFRVTARGEGVSYQWEYMTPTGYWEDVTNLNGRDGDTLTVPVTAEDDGNLYRCRVTCQGVTINSRYMILTVSE